MTQPPLLSRRAALRGIAVAALGASSLIGCFGRNARTRFDSQPKFLKAAERYRLTGADRRLLDELISRGVRFFDENADPQTGLVKDRCRGSGPDERPIASIAATGFGLTALCMAEARGFLPSPQVRRRVTNTLDFLLNRAPHEHGFFYHFMNASTGERAWQCELSSIDTAILLCGIIACGEHFTDRTIRRSANELVARVDWRWLQKPNRLMGHGWKPESGFLSSNWDHYCELMMIYLLAIGSDTHPIAPQAWHSWRRPAYEEPDFRYIGSPAPLFVHQYAHAWFDFRGQRDAYADYFRNSILATEAHRRFCVKLSGRLPHYSEDLWGITASDSARGYVVWGGPPEHGPIDGTVVPCAAAGSLPFLPAETLRTLHVMRDKHGGDIWSRYGFTDAFNPGNGWVNPDVIGINVGITTLMAENLRSGWVWRTFMRNPIARKGMKLAGFVPTVRPALPPKLVAGAQPMDSPLRIHEHLMQPTLH